ncbi:hypothetical protein AF72_06540 [Xylella taiwanensis]|uniref:Uncharacterized protein n=1 Tax=Xylella taiwanensis TaxID=1444770 RepID=Z9JJZ8_9GAMM|nr:hypothetical protein AF72_06540 [Xylella taiwanensis]
MAHTGFLQKTATTAQTADAVVTCADIEQK